MLRLYGLLDFPHVWVTSSKHKRQVQYGESCTLVFIQGQMDEGIEQLCSHGMIGNTVTLFLAINQHTAQNLLL